MHIGLGLAAACSVPLLTPEQIYTVALAHFPPPEAVDLTAITLRESGGCPTAHYTGNPVGAEDSWGLTQINVKANPSILTRLGITPAALTDPDTNMAAAALLWAGNDANLDTAWYINHGGAYTSQYQANLPIAQAAAMNVDPGDFPNGFPSGTVVANNSTADPGNWLSSVAGELTSTDVSLAGFQVPVLYLALGGLAIVALLALM